MQELAAAIRERRALLFAGAGLSVNLGLPSFNGLIRKIAEELDFDEDIFQASGDYLSLAEYYNNAKGTLGPLRSWMDTTWHDSSVDISSSLIHRAIVELKFPLIYTTNYDRWIEKAHEVAKQPYAKITNVSSIASAKEGVTQIVKLHGDFDDDSSIVLTESSYFERLSFESPLDIRLRSDVLGKSVLFLGYSLSDINIRYLLYRLQKQWASSESDRDRPSSYIFLTKPNLIQEELFRARGVTPIVAKNDDPKDATLEFLDDLLAETHSRRITS